MTPPERKNGPSVMNGEAVDSISIIARQTPIEKEKEEEDDFERRFGQSWGDARKSLSKIPFGQGWIGQGKRLMEVFEVRIICNRRKNPKLNIHGTVTVDSSLGISDIFRRMRQSPEVIHSKDTLTLMSPHIAALANDHNYINLDIKDGRREVCKGHVLWSYYHRRISYNKPLTGMVTGKNGVGLVTYAIFNCAMLIHVEIKLPKIEVFNFEVHTKLDPIKIYGRVDASVTKVVTFNSVTTTLFRRKHTDSARVGAEGSILPLSKSLIAFPLGGTIELSVHLKEHLPFYSGNCNIAIDTVKCVPDHFGHHKCKIDSKYGPIKVKLTAYPAYAHPNTLAALKELLRH